MAKSSTIKFRVADETKARWEAQAKAEGISLSRLIRDRVDAPVLLGPWVDEPPAVAPSLQSIPFKPYSPAASPNLGFQPTKPRRTTPCACGRPTYLFCATCDA